MGKKAKRPLPLPLCHLHHPKAQPLRGWQKRDKGKSGSFHKPRCHCLCLLSAYLMLLDIWTGLTKMPKTRKPKAAAPVADQVSAALAKAKNKLTPEELKRYQFLLEDYDRQIEKKIDEIHKKAMDKVESHYRECMVRLGH